MHVPLPSLPGLRIGHATDDRLKSGVTVFLPDEPAVAAVHVAGGAPGTRETDLLAPEETVARIDAIVLSGGSGFGLAAADGVTAWLAARGRGFPVGDVRVPIVPAAILFDLVNGGDKSAIPGLGGVRSPYGDLGAAACGAATAAPALGSVGAGTGALTADLKGGFGAALSRLSCGASIAAFAAVNALGRVTLGTTAHFRAAPFEEGAEFGGLGLPAALPPDAGHAVTKRHPKARGNTTIAVLATDLALGKAQAKRLAVAAHDGLALAIFPAHTPFDGDTVFVLSTGRMAGADPLGDLCEASAAAAATLARAVTRGVHSATPAPGDTLPTWRQRYGDAR